MGLTEILTGVPWTTAPSWSGNQSQISHVSLSDFWLLNTPGMSALIYFS